MREGVEGESTSYNWHKSDKVPYEIAPTALSFGLRNHLLAVDLTLSIHTVLAQWQHISGSKRRL